MLTYGVYVPSGGLRAWEVACLRALCTSGNARLACIVEEHNRYGPLSGPEQPYARFQSSLHVPAQEIVPSEQWAQLAQSAIRIDAWQQPTNVQWRDDVTRLGLDFILLFGDSSAGAELIDSARYGVWSFVFGDPEKFVARVPVFWEMYNGVDVTGATLTRLQADGSLGIPLKGLALSTSFESITLGLDNLLNTLADVPAQVCREIDCGLADGLSKPSLAMPPRVYGYPTQWHILKLRAAQAVSTAQRYVQNRFFTIDWNVFSVSGSPEQFIGTHKRAQLTSVLPYAKGEYVADPFVVQHGEETYVFCERYYHGEKRGLVVSVALGDKAPHAEPAIEEPYHLSYPHIFLYDDELYCIAESAAMRLVGLYRAVDFPNKWQQVGTLLSGFRAADATLLRARGKWWLFCTGGEKGPKFGDNTHLYIWFADDLNGTWSAHPRNPVKIDVRSARPAGQFFSKDGVLYRPAQDCSRTYGGAISINRVDMLSETDFEETVVGTIRPPLSGYNKGIHTISSSGSWCIVDAKRYIFNPAAIVGALAMWAKATALRGGMRPETIATIKRLLGRCDEGCVPVAAPPAEVRSYAGVRRNTSD